MYIVYIDLCTYGPTVIHPGAVRKVKDRAARGEDALNEAGALDSCPARRGEKIHLEYMTVRLVFPHTT